MTYYLGRAGALVALPDPEVGLSMTPDRIGGTHQLLSGARVRDTLGRMRTWNLSWTALDTSSAWVLDLFFSGSAGPGPYYFFDAEQRNLLPRNVAASGSVTSDTTGFNAGVGVTLSTLGSLLTKPPTRIFMSEPASVTAVQVTLGTSGYLPVVGGLPYTLSMWYTTSARSHYAEIVWYDASKTVISTSDGTASASTGWLTVTGTAPSNAAYVICNVNVSTNSGSTQGVSVEQIQFEQSSSRSPWVPGLGVPLVTVEGLPKSTPMSNIADVQMTLVQVG